MNTPTIPDNHRRRLQSNFGFDKVPFRKNMHANEMYDSRSQRELLAGLTMWTEVRGLALSTGPSGVGKSITIRRFATGLDEARYRVVHLTYATLTAHGFLRSLNRALGLPMRGFAADLFDQAQQHLCTHADDRGPHPLLILDDAEAMGVDAFDVVRRLTAYNLDAEDRFSILVTGTDDVLRTLRHPKLEPLRNRFGFAQTLKPFGLEDARNYINFHIRRAGGKPNLLSDDASRRVFQASKGRPRAINQLCLQLLIAAAIEGMEELTGTFVQAQIAAHPLYDGAGEAA
jgi:type II secretory pathway predicted ATPase ExeA